VAIHSDMTLFSEGLRSLLGGEPSLTVVQGVSSSRPQVVLLDGRMDGALGQCAALAGMQGRPCVLVVAGTKDEGWIAKALRAGARGILLPNFGVDLLKKAIRVVLAGEIWAPRSAVAATGARGGPTELLPEQMLIDRGLSGREIAVCQHAAFGLSNKEIAERLHISPATVKAHLTRVFQKLGLGSRTQLAALCFGMGSLEAP
jgi:DNA-binding NarL/FixJ family response regulator